MIASSILQTICILIAIFVCTVQGFLKPDHKAAFNGKFKVLRIVPKNHDELILLQSLYKVSSEFQLDFWKRPTNIGVFSDLMVPPEYVASMIELLEQYRIEHNVIIEDVQKLILEREKPKQISFMEKHFGGGMISELLSPFFGRRMRDDSTSGYISRNKAKYGFGEYKSYHDIMLWLNEIELWYPHMAKTFSIGKTHEGREIMGIKIGIPIFDTTKRVVWIDGGMHAREWAAIHTALYFIEKLISESDTDPQISAYLKTLNFYIVPVANPDGYEFTRSDVIPMTRLWRKNRGTQVCKKDRWRRERCCGGVDLNRNFDFHWGESGSSNELCSEIYQGPNAFSEPESRAIRDKMLSPELYGKVDAFITLHTYSQMWIYPYNHRRNAFPDNIQELEDIGKRGVRAIEGVYGTKYRFGTGADILYPSAGGSDDWAKATAKVKYVFLLELRPGEREWKGYFLDRHQLMPTAKETWEGVKVVIDAVMRNAHAQPPATNSPVPFTSPSIDPPTTTPAWVAPVQQPQSLIRPQDQIGNVILPPTVIATTINPIDRILEENNLRGALDKWLAHLPPKKPTASTNECQDPKMNDCHQSAECIDQPNSYTCRCRPGYKDTSPDGSNRPGRVCKKAQVNECKLQYLNNCNRNAECIDLVDGYQCRCNPGFKDLRPDRPGRLCKQMVNECERAELNTCDRSAAACQDLEKGYTCNCLDGYVDRSPNLAVQPGRVCGVPDTCPANDCSTAATCEPLGGNIYRCTCKHGYEDQSPAGLQGRTCTRIRSCADVRLNNCSTNAICYDDTRGSDGYLCECRLGFVDNSPNALLKGRVCDEPPPTLPPPTPPPPTLPPPTPPPPPPPTQPRDPCQEAHDCHSFAKCRAATNAQTFTCDCLPGYTDRSPDLVMKPGRECVPAVSICRDSSRNDCHQTGICIVTTAFSEGYTCRCRNGYSDQSVDKMLKPGRICIEQVNECLDRSLNDCDPSALCEDQPVGYTCRCPSNSIDQSQDEKRPGRKCLAQVNECASPALNNCNEHADCTDLSSGYTCTCRAPFLDNGPTDQPGRVCRYNECLDPTMNDCDQTNALCEDTDNGYTCRCREGFVDDSSSSGRQAGRVCTFNTFSIATEAPPTTPMITRSRSSDQLNSACKDIVPWCSVWIRTAPSICQTSTVYLRQDCKRSCDYCDQ